VLIAIALAGDPEVIVADEPTSALDVTVQKVILDHLESLVRDRGISLVIITHDLAVAADRADRVLVMKDGRLVEQGRADDVLSAPADDYTRQLLLAAPSLAAGGRIVAHHTDVLEAPEILRLEGVSKVYALPRTTSGSRTLTALDDVTLRVGKGQTLGIVGESGSGKTTLLRLALGLEQPTSGRIVFEDRDITGLSWRELRPLRRRFQLVQQNPYASIDPRFTVERAIVEPLVSFGIGSRADRHRRAAELADLVALPSSSLDRPARELSGGQRQRVAIARALALEPDLVFLDEPVSALDVSVQAQILALLADLQETLGLTYVFVSHDLSVVGELAHHVAVLAAGSVVEHGVAEQVLTAPTHDLVRRLIAAVPGVRVPA
jgi:peptide/nickel transport system ATP-binding protein